MFGLRARFQLDRGKCVYVFSFGIAPPTADGEDH